MTTTDPAVSIVVPVRNEAGNIAPLVEEIAAAVDGQWPFEVVYVNDGSSDTTDDELRSLMARYPWLRRVRHKQSCGQSAAVRSGVTAARAPLVVTLEGTGRTIRRSFQHSSTLWRRARRAPASLPGSGSGARQAVSRDSSRALRIRCGVWSCATGPATPAVA